MGLIKYNVVVEDNVPLYADACSNYFNDYYLGNLADPTNTNITNGAVYNNVLLVPPEKTDASG